MLQRSIRLLRSLIEVFLLPKAKCAWLKDGDANIKMFQSNNKKRQLQNAIFGIYIALGKWVSQHEEVNAAFLDTSGKSLIYHKITDPIPKNRIS